jgi:hypothetical protein
MNDLSKLANAEADALAVNASPEEKARLKAQGRIEAQDEYYRLRQNYASLRGTMTPAAILAAWFLFGDDMWVKEDNHGLE